MPPVVLMARERQFEPFGGTDGNVRFSQERWLRLAGSAPAIDFPIRPDLLLLLNAVEGLFAKLTRRRLKHGLSTRSWTFSPPHLEGEGAWRQMRFDGCGITAN